MERLALCSKILYDIDLLDKQKEIYELKKEINTPKIYFENSKIWESKKAEMYNIIKNIIDELIIDSDSEYEDYENILYNGLTSAQRIKINHVLYNELNKLTDYKYCTWCENKAYDIVYSVEGAVQGLIYSDKIGDFREYEMAEFIYRNIIWQLGDNTHFPSILDDIPFYIKNTTK
jgi:hypothetical protein